MKKIIVFIILFSIIYSCKKDENKTTVNDLKTKVLSVSDCKLKSAEIAENYISQECVVYDYDGSSVLLLKIENIAFNCCFDTLVATTQVLNNNIVVSPKVTGDECHCDCVYDINLEITSLNQGEYLFKLVEPIMGTGNDTLKFSIDLRESIKDTFCVTRNGYPWIINEL
jgi:hypothetical protein